MPGPQLLQAVRGVPRVPRKVPARAHRVGRLLPLALHRGVAQCQVRGFRGQGPGRRHAARTARRTARRARFLARPRPVVQGPVRPARAHRRAPAESARTIFPGCRTIAWTPRSTSRARSWARAPRSIRPASAARSAAISAAWCRCTTARRWSRRRAPPPSSRTCKRSTASTRCSSTTTTSSCARITRANWPTASRRSNLRWWCEARVDIVLGYSDDTLRRLRAAGCVMIFFGVESGNDEVLRDMKKQLTVGADPGTGAPHPRVRHRARVLDDLRQSGRCRSATLAANIAFVRRIKKVNPGGRDRRADLRAHAAAQRRVGRRGGGVSRARRTSGSPTAGIRFLIRTDPATAVAAAAREAPHSTISKP